MSDYKIIQAACRCLRPKRREFIQSVLDVTADLSDGAFFAILGERGIDVTELEPFSLEHDCRKKP